MDYMLTDMVAINMATAIAFMDLSMIKIVVPYFKFLIIAKKTFHYYYYFQNLYCQQKHRPLDFDAYS